MPFLHCARSGSCEKRQIQVCEPHKKTGCHCWQPVFSKPNRSGLFCRLLDDRLQSSGGADLGKLFGAEAEDLFENFVSVLAE